MWIASALLVMVLLVVAYFYCRNKTKVPQKDKIAPPFQREPASELPAGYYFHLGHTWMAEQGKQQARVGIDSFAATLLGKVEKIAVTGEQRWVRQGQKLITLISGGETVYMLSPLEGVVTAVNADLLKDPSLLFRNPYQGWVCTIKSPEIETNVRNLLPAVTADSWMKNSLDYLKTLMVQADTSLAQDGGMPLPGLLSKLTPELRQQVVKEFFLT
jgi:glycine cleavage system H lipoate-binding protein